VQLKIVVTLTALMFCAIGRAEAVTFNVIGANLSGSSITGTIEADPALTSITSVSLTVSGSGPVPNGLREVLTSFGTFLLPGAPVLAAESPNSRIYVYLSFAGVPDLSALIAEHVATYDPSQCDTNTSCIAFVTAQRDAPFFTTLSIADAPLPAGFPLFASAIGTYGFLAYRNRRISFARTS
jgi:hypothetical protein